MEPAHASRSTPPLRIVHVVGTANGAAWAHQQLRELRARGHQVSAIIGGDGGTLAARLEADGIRYDVADLDVLADDRPAAAARRVLGLAGLLRRLRPDVVHYHLFPSIVAGRIAAWLADVPVRVSMIPGPYYLEAPGLSLLDARTAPLDTRVIASCEYTRELYQRHGVPRAHVALVYYGQDPGAFDPDRADRSRVRRELGIDPGRPVVGDVAYFYPPLPDGPFTPRHLVGRGIKGHDVLLRAVPLVLAQVPDVLFLLVGAGWGPDGAAYQQQLEALAADLGVSHAVRFTGPRSDVPDTLVAFDVSVQCSLNENLGGSIESLLMGVPLVATAVGGLVDAVHHERTGLLVPPDDAPALARAIVRLLEDRSLASELAAAGRAHARSRLTLDRTVSDLDALYTRELAACRNRAGYRPWRSAGRVAWLAVGAWWFTAPVRRALAEYRRRTAPAAPEGAVRSFWHRARGRDLRLWDAPVAAQNTGAPRIVLVAGVIDDGDWFVALCRARRASTTHVAAIVASPEGRVAESLRGLGVPCQPVGFGATHAGRLGLLVDYALRLPWTAIRLAALFRRERIAVVHVHVSATIVGARVAAWLARVPCRVSTVRAGPGGTSSPAAWLERATRWMDHRVATDDTVDPLTLCAPHMTPVVQPDTDR